MKKLALVLALFAFSAQAMASQGYLFPMASSSADGYLSSADYAMFSAAAPAASPSFTGNITDSNGHVISHQTTPPVATVGGAAGSGATCAVSHGTDIAGVLTIATGGSGTGTGSLCSLAFHTAYGVAPICVLHNAGATAVTGVYVTSSTSAVVINVSSTAPTSASIVYNYHCIQTQ